MSTIPPPVEQPGHHEGGVTDAENSIELKEIAGLSQGQIVRKRFFRHRGALISMVVLAFIIVLAFTSKSSRAPKAEGIPYDKGSR